MRCLLFLKSRTPDQSWAPLTYRPAASATRPFVTPRHATALPSAWTPHPTAPKGRSATAPPLPPLPPGTVTALWAAAPPLLLPLIATPWPQTGTQGRFGWNWSQPGSWDAGRKMREMMEGWTQGRGKGDRAVHRLWQNIQSLRWAQMQASGRVRCRDLGHTWTGWCRRYWTPREPTSRICAAL